MPVHAKRFWRLVGTVLAVGRCMRNGSGGRAVRKTVLAVGSAVMAVESAVMAVRFSRHSRTLGGVGSGGWKCRYGG